MHNIGEEPDASDECESSESCDQEEANQEDTDCNAKSCQNGDGDWEYCDAIFTKSKKQESCTSGIFARSCVLDDTKLSCANQQMCTACPGYVAFQAKLLECGYKKEHDLDCKDKLKAQLCPLTDAAIAGIVVGALALAICIAVGICYAKKCLCFKKKGVQPTGGQ